MFRLRHKFFLSVALLATSIFLSVSLGGEFFHQKVHHHESKAAHDDCPVHQLLVQAFLFAVAIAFSVRPAKVFSVVSLKQTSFSSVQYLQPPLRAPPISL
jgi:hypothetical protein